MNIPNNIQEELKNIAPTLAAMPKVAMHNIPDTIYFEGLQQRILNQISTGAKKEINLKENPFEKLLQQLLIVFHPKFSIAYITVGALIFVSNYFNETIPANTYLPVSVIENYIQEENFSEEDITMQLNTSDIDTLEKQFAANNSLPETSIEQYIIDNHLETLIEEEYL